MSAVPSWQIADDGVHVEWLHDCLDMAGALAILPLGGEGWHVDQLEPLTISPSILCYRCRTHGFIREGRWVEA